MVELAKECRFLKKAVRRRNQPKETKLQQKSMCEVEQKEKQSISANQQQVDMRRSGVERPTGARLGQGQSLLALCCPYAVLCLTIGFTMAMGSGRKTKAFGHKKILDMFHQDMRQRFGVSHQPVQCPSFYSKPFWHEDQS